MVNRSRILIIDDDEGVLESLKLLLKEDYHVITAETGKHGLRKALRLSIDLLLLDKRLPDMDGFILLSKLKQKKPLLPVIIITALKGIEYPKTALRMGVEDFITKPFNKDQLKMIVSRTLERKKHPDLSTESLLENSGFDYSGIVTENSKMLEILKEVSKISQSDSTVLIYGESGTGKELIARSIHNNSSRAEHPFIAIHCAAIPINLLESELFGHEQGAFTGAHKRKIGTLERADTGTLFLDEIGTLPLELQVKLLRVIQERNFKRVGGNRLLKTDIRIIAATNVDLQLLIHQEKFRSDLFYRLSVVPLTLPPLRERKSDIPLLVKHFMKMYSKKSMADEKIITKDIIEILHRYPWPGNIRELENTIERIITLSEDKYISVKDLPLEMIMEIKGHNNKNLNTRTLKIATESFEKAYLLKVLNRFGWNIGKSAEVLGIHRNSLTRKIKKHKLKQGN